MTSLAEMYVQGVSTRKVKAITEELCGHAFSASSISRINKRLDSDLAKFAERGLEEEYPYLILDARYEKIRQDSVIRTQAVQVAIGINWDGRRSILAVELANRESQNSWRDFLSRLRKRGLRGVEFVVTDDHAGLKRAIAELLPEAIWQRCYAHFLRNALDYLPRRANDDCMQELRWIYDRRDLSEARRDLAAWLKKWQSKHSKLCDWVESNIEETLSFYRLPRQHHKHLKSTNMLERLNEEIKRRTHVVRIFPNRESCPRLVRALGTETHENWIEATRYLNMSFLREQKKEAMRPGDDQIMPLADPAAGTQRQDLVPVQIAAVFEVHVFQRGRIAELGRTRTAGELALLAEGPFRIDQQTETFVKAAIGVLVGLAVAV